MGEITEWLFKETFPSKARLIKRLELHKYSLENEAIALQRWNEGLTKQIDQLGDILAEKTLELESLKKKIVERAQVPTTIKAKTAAEIRSLMEREAEREFEESANAG